MSWLKLILPALAGAQIVSAQCSAKTTTIKDAATASALAQRCRTFTGTIAIATGNTDPIDLSGIEVIKNGGIKAMNNGNLPSITANDLTTIQDGSFHLENVTQLSGLNFPMLTRVDELIFKSLASLYGWTFTSGISEAQTVVISDTHVNSLDGINLKTVDSLNINNNQLLADITMQLSNITGALIISEINNPTVSFPSLQSANNMTYNGISALTLSSLKMVTQGFGIYESSFTNFSAPKLTQVGGLSIFKNPQLSSISVPKLELVTAALTITNNPMLSKGISFPKLGQIRGTVKITGDFTHVSMPKVSSVRGAFSIISTEKIGDTCKPFQSLVGNQIQGTYHCHGATPSASSSPQHSGSGTNTGSSSSTSTAAANNLDNHVHVVGGLLGLFLAIIGLL